MNKKTYISNKTGSPHTYDFYLARRNDPKWREDFLRVQEKRKKELLIYFSSLFLLIIACFLIYFLAPSLMIK